jgi:Na+:H+ antiporter, NhaA family
MTAAGLNHRIDRPVDENYDHVLGPANAQVTLVEYGSYACPYCRAANEQIAAVRDEFGERLRYVFRHRPLTNNDLARRAAELVERAGRDQFWKTHLQLMTRSETLTESDLRAVAEDLGVVDEDTEEYAEAIERAKARVNADERSAKASGVRITPTFFINGRRYDGP